LIALSVGEVLIVYLIPVVAFLLVWLGLSLLVYVLVKSPLDFAFKQDLLHKFAKKRVLPSGADRLTFLYLAKLLLGDSCVQATLLYRISRFLQRHKLRTLAQMVQAFSRFLTHTDISPQAIISPGFYLYHGIGTAIGKGTRIGRRAIICHDVSISGAVTIGDDVKVWPGAQIIANVTIGDRSEVGANAVVIGDFPADSIIFGVPARVTGVRSFFTEEAPDAPIPQSGKRGRLDRERHASDE
jgi:serine O-acetyltransferase